MTLYKLNLYVLMVLFSVFFLTDTAVSSSLYLILPENQTIVLPCKPHKEITVTIENMDTTVPGFVMMWYTRGETRSGGGITVQPGKIEKRQILQPAHIQFNGAHGFIRIKITQTGLQGSHVET